MLSKRTIAVAADTPLRKRVMAALMAAGSAVEGYRSPEEVSAADEVDLALICTGGGNDRAWLDKIAPQLRPGVPIIVIIPTASLEETVALHSKEGVAAVLAADELETSELANVAARLLFGDIFGAEKLVPWGVRVHAVFVGDYDEKSIAITEISEFAERLGVRRKYRELIEQCLDEMLMNALYDAPPENRGASTRERRQKKAGRKALVEYACDGTTFALSVRDAYGSLDRDTVVWYLDKCLHAKEQIDRKDGGAGLGLYLIANASTHFFVNIQPGVATEVSCRFDLSAPKVQLKGLGVFEEKQPAGDAPAAAEGGRAPAPRGLMAALVTSVAVIFVLIGMVAYPQFKAVPVGDIRVEVEPDGAEIELAGDVREASSGQPVIFSDLEAGEHHIISARKDGYEDRVEVVAAREDEVVAIDLALEPEAVAVAFETDPPGADLFVDDELRGRTPHELALAAGDDYGIRFEREGYEPVRKEVRARPGDSERTVSESLQVASGRGMLSLETEPPGAAVAIDGHVLEGLSTPIEEYALPAGEPVEISFSRPGFAPEVRELTPEEGERRAIRVDLEPGATIDASVNVRARVAIPELECDGLRRIRACPAPRGDYRIDITSEDPFVRESFRVSVGEEDVSSSLPLGVVATDSQDYHLDIEGAPEGTRRAALRPGEHRVRVTDVETGETQEVDVEVEAGETTRVSFD